LTVCEAHFSECPSDLSFYAGTGQRNVHQHNKVRDRRSWILWEKQTLT
jgi:hypothetical protein